MYTLGGIFDKDEQRINQIKDIDFVKIKKEYITIDVPLLTYSEKSYIDSNIDTIKQIIKSSEDNVPLGIDQRIEKIENEVRVKVEQAKKFALESHEPRTESLMDNIYSQEIK